jgi:hypothetical protein
MQQEMQLKKRKLRKELSLPCLDQLNYKKSLTLRMSSKTLMRHSYISYYRKQFWVPAFGIFMISGLFSCPSV